ncbi:putative sulfate exporter family transporter [Desulfocapsa sp. AH-315-G09]|nr:putative sulfate exporter family transporter [Desulfocapsa sp.]MBN4048866.1 putative sulfate exporter family transporter [bacterium AH-315-N22]MBN4065544.1 putative sulfate exporter family transporter [Desulfocapsa sp. AH-315-G09]
MSQIKDQMPTLIMGGSLLMYGLIAKTGALLPVVKYLQVHKTLDLQVTMTLIVGCIAILGGLVNATRKSGTTKLDIFVLRPLGGIVLILVMAMAIRWYAEPLMKIVSTALQPVLGFKMYKVLNLNYVVLGILAGVVLTNTWGIPKFAGEGVKCARFVLKMGVIMLGARYSFAELAKLGAYSVFLVGFFVLGTVFLVLWLGNLFKQPKSMTGVLSAGMGVCGVSATVAVAPVVKAKSAEMAYTIGTILSFGIVCMFVFPTIGKLAGMSPVQFGAWAGTGILNSAQVAAAALAFNAVDIETLKVAEIFNITRVLFLPIIVLVLATWFGKETGQKLSFKSVVIDKFPVFIIGFLILFFMSSVGFFSPPSHYKGKYIDVSYNDRTQVTPEEWEILNSAMAANEFSGLTPKQLEAVTDLVEQHQIAGNFDERNDKKTFDRVGRARMAQLEGVLAAAKAKQITLSADVKSAIKHAVKQVHKKSKTVVTLTDFMIWFFAFGLIGLGMQITKKSITQAGGWPIVMGVIAGITKATLSFFVVLWLIKDVVLN